MGKSILVVEDDIQIQELIYEFLKSQDYDVHCAKDGIEGYEKFKSDSFDLVILDVMMPNLDGYGLCKLIRNMNRAVPIIFLTALGEEQNEIKAFELQADDYIVKPFSFNILIKRVEAILRRNRKDEGEWIVFEELKLNLNTFKCYLNDEEFEVTLKEFNILKVLIESYPRVANREFLMDKIWGYDYYGDMRVIDTHIKNIRKKINYKYLKTVKGIGYVLEK
ncbi:MAG: response regulator transcription factor [Clostridium sp.]